MGRRRVLPLMISMSMSLRLRLACLLYLLDIFLFTVSPRPRSLFAFRSRVGGEQLCNWNRKEGGRGGRECGIYCGLRIYARTARVSACPWTVDCGLDSTGLSSCIRNTGWCGCPHCGRKQKQKQGEGRRERGWSLRRFVIVIYAHIIIFMIFFFGG
jgi:hypothetical protein